MKALPKQAIELIQKAFPDLQSVYLFGSHASGDDTERSDIDIALLLPPAVARDTSALSIYHLQEGLADYFQRDVDVVNLRTANTVFQNEIVSNGIRFDFVDKFAPEEFEMLSLSFYQRLNEERALIIEDIVKSGRIYS